MGTVLVVQSDSGEPIAERSIAERSIDEAIAAGGHTIRIAASSNDAMAIVDAGGVDVVVIDALDPRVRVMELAKRLDALVDALPIVLVSSSPHAPEISARIGVSAFFPKPYEPAELVAAIDRLVPRSLARGSGIVPRYRG